MVTTMQINLIRQDVQRELRSQLSPTKVVAVALGVVAVLGILGTVLYGHSHNNQPEPTAQASTQNAEMVPTSTPAPEPMPKPVDMHEACLGQDGRILDFQYNPENNRTVFRTKSGELQVWVMYWDPSAREWKKQMLVLGTGLPCPTAGLK